MAEDIKFEGRFWAIVSDGQKQYIGRTKTEATEKEMAAYGNNCPPLIELEPCYEFLSLLQMIRLPDGSSAPAREVMVLPVDKCKHNVCKRFRPTSITWAEDIHENDRTLYRNLIRDLQQQALEAREQELIEKPPPGFDVNKLVPIPGGGSPFGRT